MKIIHITNNKKEYLPLLLLGDEQESMIDQYLEKSDMFILKEDDVKAQCVISQESSSIYELKNIAVYPQYQCKGYAQKLIQFLFQHYADCHTMYVGTGDSPLSIPFYKKCGFTESHRVKNFFIDNYDHPIIEGGEQLIDMVYFKWTREK